MTLSKNEARRLAKNAVELDARILRGVLKIDPEGAKLNDINIVEWLARHAGTELMLIAAPVENGLFEDEIKSCRTCGRDYQGDRCAYCAEARARLRGGYSR